MRTRSPNLTDHIVTLKDNISRVIEELQHAIAAGNLQAQNRLLDDIKVMSATLTAVQPCATHGMPTHHHSDAAHVAAQIERATKSLGPFSLEQRTSPEAYWARLVFLRSSYALTVSQTRDVLARCVEGVSESDND